MHIKIIVNPRAGNGKAREIGHEVEKHLCKKGIEYGLDSTFRPGGATSLAKKAVRDGFDMIIAVGGDGTVNEIANGIIGSSAIMAIIPAGTQNNFSKLLGLNPKNIAQACDIALSGNVKNIDVGKINDKFFLNDIGIGLTADIAKGFDMIKMFSKIFKFEPPHLKIKMGDIAVDSKIVMTKISNTGSDGQFDVCLFNDTDKFKLMYHLPRYFAGNEKSAPLSKYKSENITIDSEDPLQVVCDGEFIACASKYNISFSQEKIPVKSR